MIDTATAVENMHHARSTLSMFVMIEHHPILSAGLAAAAVVWGVVSRTAKRKRAAASKPAAAE
jgi:hypothetical protein